MLATCLCKAALPDCCQQSHLLTIPNSLISQCFKNTVCMILNWDVVRNRNKSCKSSALNWGCAEVLFKMAEGKFTRCYYPHHGKLAGKGAVWVLAVLSGGALDNPVEHSQACTFFSCLRAGEGSVRLPNGHSHNCGLASKAVVECCINPYQALKKTLMVPLH